MQIVRNIEFVYINLLSSANLAIIRETINGSLFIWEISTPVVRIYCSNCNALLSYSVSLARGLSLSDGGTQNELRKAENL